MKAGFINNQSIPFLRTDPEGRCAAMLVFGRKIIILPFKRDLGGQAMADEVPLDGLADPPGLGGGATSGPGSSDKTGSTQRVPVLASYTLDLDAVVQTHKVDNIIDIQFLHGYNQPTLLILYEPLKTFAG